MSGNYSYSFYSKYFVFAGIWSSIFSLSLTQLWSAVTGVIPSWASKVGEEVNHSGKSKAGTIRSPEQIIPVQLFKCLVAYQFYL